MGKTTSTWDPTATAFTLFPLGYIHEQHKSKGAAVAYSGPATGSALLPGWAQNERLGEQRYNLVHRAVSYLLPSYGFSELPFTANSGSHFTVRRATWGHVAYPAALKGRHSC